MPRYSGPLLTLEVADALRAASGPVRASFDLGRTVTEAAVEGEGFAWQGARYPLPAALKPRTVYYFDGEDFSPLQRYGGALIKLVPTPWGAPTFEIDGIKMLPTSQLSPFEDARRKVALVQPRGKRLLDTCGGLGYFAACALDAGAARIESFEKNEDVIWLRQHNPWSPDIGGALQLEHADIAQRIAQLPDSGFDAALHDPPRFGIAGELYSQAFYDQLARVLRPGAPLFHYTGTPNAKTSGRDVPGEVSKRLGKSGFSTQRMLDGVLATRRR